MELSHIKNRVVLFASVGCVLGVLYSFGGFFIDLFVTLGWAASTETPGLSFGTVLAFTALIGMPFIGAVCGLGVGLVEIGIRSFLKKNFSN